MTRQIKDVTIPVRKPTGQEADVTRRVAEVRKRGAEVLKRVREEFFQGAEVVIPPRDAAQGFAARKKRAGGSREPFSRRSPVNDEVRDPF